MSRQSIRNAPPFYDTLQAGLPEALHETFVHEKDVQDAIAWLEDGTPIPPGRQQPTNGERIKTPDRHLIRSYSRTKAGSRQILFSKWRFSTNEIQELCEGWRGVTGFQVGGRDNRVVLEARGRGNARRYHAWYANTGDTERDAAGPMRLYRYDKPASEFELDEDDPSKTEIPLNKAQHTVLRQMDM